MLPKLQKPYGIIDDAQVDLHKRLYEACVGLLVYGIFFDTTGPTTFIRIPMVIDNDIDAYAEEPK